MIIPIFGTIEMTKKYQSKFLVDGSVNPRYKLDDRRRPGHSGKHKQQTGYLEHAVPIFVAVDGEGWNGLYTLIQSSTGQTLYDPGGLSTRRIFDFLTNPKLGKRYYAYILYGANYDFEHWLRDLSEGDYQKLLAGEAVRFERWLINYVPRQVY